MQLTVWCEYAYRAEASEDGMIKVKATPAVHGFVIGH
jgi:hypothetical protein